MQLTARFFLEKSFAVALRRASPKPQNEAKITRLQSRTGKDIKKFSGWSFQFSAKEKSGGAGSFKS